MSKCIVTGATGFIGRALCEELLAQGDEVYALIRPQSAKRQILDSLAVNERLHIVEAPLEALADSLAGVGISADVFFHLAWHGSAGAAREDFSMQARNISYMEQALLGAKVCGCSKFVGAGSQAEYGVVQERAYEGQTLARPFMMYGAAKHAAYQMGRLLARQLGIAFVWPRIYSVYGVGENPGTLVNYVLDSLAEKQVPELSPCENMWNFLYITDCAKILAALGKVQAAEGIYHVASDDTRPLKDFVSEIRDRVAPGAELGFGMREASPERTFWLEPDTTKLKEIVRLEYVPFATGIDKKIKLMGGVNSDEYARKGL